MSNIGEAGGPHPCEQAVALVAENDPWIRRLICDLLAQAGYRVAEASNGFSAVRLAKRERLALALLDLALPERSGLSVLAELRAAPATACVPVIMLNGQPYGLRDAVIQADAVIVKPFAIDTLLAVVNRSRQRTAKLAAYCRSATSAREIARRPGEVEADVFLDACARRFVFGDAAHRLPSASESPASGDAFHLAAGEYWSLGWR